MNDSTIRVPGIAIAFAVIAGALLAGCDSGLPFPLVRFDVRLEADARTRDSCGDAAAVAFDPVQIAPQVAGNLYQMTAFTYTAPIVGTPVQDGPDNYECWYEYRSPALSPGKWKITGEFADGSKSCLRDIGTGFPAGVAIDQEEGCIELRPPAASGAQARL